MADSNQDLQRRRDAAFARGLGNQLPVYVGKARNAEIWDVEGRRYIDFAAGIAVLNTGHLHPKVQAAVAKQLDAFSHTCLMITPYAVAVDTDPEVDDAQNPENNTTTVDLEVFDRNDL